jgi:hypothetical protein
MSSGSRSTGLGTALAAIVLFGCGYGCGGGGGGGGPSGPTMGPVEVIDGLFVADVTIDGSTARKALLDTGSPITVLAPTMDAQHSIPAGIGTLTDLDFGGRAFQQVPVVGVDIFGSSGNGIAGIIGCTVMCQVSLLFDYRGTALTLDPNGPLAGVEAGTEIPFQLLGGGQVPGLGIDLELPASRIVISASVEGVPHSFIVDTGAEMVALRAAVLNPLLADGRGTLREIEVTASSTGTEATLARLRSIDVSGVSTQRIVASTDAAFDTVLENVSKETGQTIDGSLGATFLREFAVTIDYPNRKLRFQRYASEDHIIDWTVRVGVEIGADQSGHVIVSSVLPNTDAAKQGVQAGDVISAIDGAGIASAGVRAIDVLGKLSGAVGSSHQITFGCSGCAGASGTRSIAVDDLLPLP